MPRPLNGGTANRREDQKSDSSPNATISITIANSNAGSRISGTPIVARDQVRMCLRSRLPILEQRAKNAGRPGGLPPTPAETAVEGNSGNKGLCFKLLFVESITPFTTYTCLVPQENSLEHLTF